MNSESGWIKIHRKIMDNQLYRNPHILQLFIHCLLKANHKEKKIIFNNQEIILKRGQFITGRFQLARELNQNHSSVYKRLAWLKQGEILDIKSNNKFSIITILKYSTYQNLEFESNNKVTTKEQQNNTDKNKRIKEVNKEEENNILIFPKNLKDIITVEIWEDWIKHRKEIKKPLTESAVKKQVSFLLKQNNPIECIESSIRNGYTGLFEVKPSKNGFYKPTEMEPEKF